MKSARAAAFRALHPHFRPLGDFVEEATVMVRPWEQPEKAWPVYGVNNRTGVVLSHHQPGAEFNAPYKHIERDWFFHNPTRANVGSLGRVPAVPPDALTSPEYQVWRIRHGLLPDFVEILIRLPFFLDLVECHRVGAVKERLFVENLREIPIPPLAETEQLEIVKRWNDAQARVRAARERVEDARKHADAELLAALGFGFQTQKGTQKCFTLKRSETERWDTFFYRADFMTLESDIDRIPHCSLGELLRFESRSWRESDFPNGEFNYIEISAVTKEEGIKAAVPTKISEAPSRATTLVREGDILLATTRPYLGAFAVVAKEFDRCVCSSGFALATNLLTDEIDRDFLMLFLKSPAGLRQFERRMTGGLYPAIVQDELERIRVPLISKPEQERIVTLFGSEMKRVKLQLEEAIRRASEETANIEGLLLGAS